MEYDAIAAHALLCILRGSKKAVEIAAKGVDRRCRQSAAFLSEIPESLIDCDAFASASEEGVNKQNDNKEVQRGNIMDMCFHAQNEADGRSAIEELLELKPIHCPEGTPGHSIAVSRESTFSDLSSRACRFPILEHEMDNAAKEKPIESARAFLKIGK